MNHAKRLGFGILLCSGLAGCGGEGWRESDGEPVGVAEGAVVTENAIVPNAIVPNAIVPNAIVPNALAPSALALGSLDTASLAALQDPGTRGTLSRLFLKYAVGCALDATQSFSFTWTDATSVVHNETYWGVIGIAPAWATSPLTDTTLQQLVSGCLAGRTNYYGTTVVISMRSQQNPLKKDVTSAEIAAYPHVEGAFWGNLFTTSPALYSCYNAANVATSRADLRVCATGYLDATGQVLPCGPITLTGACDVACPGAGSGGTLYTSCSATSGGPATTAVITTALP